MAGCFQSEIVISVKPDGSGTLTEKMTMSKSVADQMKQMMEGFGKGLAQGIAESSKELDAATQKEISDAAAKGFSEAFSKSLDEEIPKGFPLMDEKKLKEAAGKMGEGVTFVSAQKLSTDKGEGYIATYAFKDVNKLRIDTNRSEALPDAGGPGLGDPAGEAADAPKKPEFVTFQFKKGKVAELIVKTGSDQKAAETTEPKAEKPEPEDAPGGEEMAMAMMQQMFKDMKVVIAVEVVGKVVKTDAEHVSGNRATLVEMDFNKLLANPEKFKALSKVNPESVEDVKAIVKDVEGIKVETKPSVSIQFQ